MVGLAELQLSVSRLGFLSLTGYCHDLPQLLLQLHDVLAQLNVVHPNSTR